MKNKQVSESIKSKMYETCEYFNMTGDVYDRSLDLIEEIYDKQLYNGRSRNAIIGGVIYATAKYEDVPINVSEIAEYLNVKKRALILSNKYISENVNSFNTLPSAWESYVDFASKELEIQTDIRDKAYEIGNTGVCNNLLSGKKPQTYAASCIYASKKITDRKTSITQSNLSRELDVSPSTIRANYNNLVELYNNNDNR